MTIHLVKHTLLEPGELKILEKTARMVVREIGNKTKTVRGSIQKLEKPGVDQKIRIQEPQPQNLMIREFGNIKTVNGSMIKPEKLTVEIKKRIQETQKIGETRQIGPTGIRRTRMTMLKFSLFRSWLSLQLR